MDVPYVFYAPRKILKVFQVFGDTSADAPKCQLSLKYSGDASPEYFEG